MDCRTREVSTELGENIWDNEVFLYEILESHKLALHTRDDWHPEDYALYPEESMVAKPDEFFPHVIQFLKENDLPYHPTQLFGKLKAP
jgi:hypothetical protein